MTKAELVNQIASQTGYDRVTILNVVESFMSNVKDSVCAGEAVYLRGFGSFITKVRKEKIARNISAKTTIVVPEHKIPAFKPSKEFVKTIK
ncbi:MAG: integration host factor subunit beta [Paludibacter sp.]|nr:integration host factor subunit beta [Bacteroidales bacterium]MCM1069507.1 integration host factor subunit beta [Prevotella sp.]MCM1354163.1 integration host factor subunit beta [Bacteroides sp.]MCM1442980.1 integration host factor subunit beta [Muribaculum sp.]MCM1482238.1 integration host factor subunit beta [Paludibacter sp.]